MANTFTAVDTHDTISSIFPIGCEWEGLFQAISGQRCHRTPGINDVVKYKILSF